MLTMSNEARTLEVDGVALELRVVRKRVKNINARLRGKTLLVSAPHRVPEGELNESILQLARRLVRQSRADTVNSDGGAERIARHNTGNVRSIKEVYIVCQKRGGR